MRCLRKKHLSVFVSLGAMLLAACAAPVVETSVLMPAKQAGMAQAKRIGIAPLKGDRDGLYTARLQSFIGNIRVKGENHFTLVDIDRTAIMREQRLSDSALADATTAIELGRLVAADTILSGAVKNPQYRKSRSVEERRECVEGQKNERGDAYISCDKYRTYVVPCTQQSMRFSLNLRASNVATGTVSFIQDYSGAASHSYCVDTGVARDKDALAEQAVAQAFAQMRQDVAPYPVSFTISFLDYDARSGLGRKSLFFADQSDANGAFEAGLKLAGQNQSAAACVQFRKAASLFNGSPAIFHNLGVCAELDGNFDKAISFYEQAALVAPAPIGVTGDALARAKRLRGQAAKLDAQLR